MIDAPPAGAGVVNAGGHVSVMQARQASADTVSQWVTFRLGEELYGIDVLQVQEVLRVTGISPVPGAPECVLGIINLRGNVVTVIDTRVRFGLPSRPGDESSRIIVVDALGKAAGLLVDGVSEVAYVPNARIEAAPKVGADDGNRFVSGVCNRDSGLLIMLDLAKLLDME
jgi:purine-binding chemotaxis protein CheW